MNDMITSTGLNMAEINSDPQQGHHLFWEAGRELARMRRSVKWAIGDWYASLDGILAEEGHDMDDPKVARQAKIDACIKVGLSAYDAARYAKVCINISDCTARNKIGFERSRSITYGVPKSKMEQFRDDAIAGNWNMERIALEKAELTPAGKGKTEGQHLVQAFKDDQFKTAGDMLDAALDDGLSRAARARLAPRFKEIFHFLHDEALKFIKKQTKLEKARLDRELENKEAQLSKEFETSMKTLRDHEMRIRELHRHVLGVDISYQDYKRIRACLHPDRAPEGREDKFRHAFTAFDTAIRERADYIYKYNRKMLKDSGWGEYKP